MVRTNVCSGELIFGLIPHAAERHGRCPVTRERFPITKRDEMSRHTKKDTHVSPDAGERIAADRDAHGDIEGRGGGVWEVVGSRRDATKRRWRKSARGEHENREDKRREDGQHERSRQRRVHQTTSRLFRRATDWQLHPKIRESCAKAYIQVIRTSIMSVQCVLNMATCGVGSAAMWFVGRVELAFTGVGIAAGPERRFPYHRSAECLSAFRLPRPLLRRRAAAACHRDHRTGPGRVRSREFAQDLALWHPRRQQGSRRDS